MKHLFFFLCLGIITLPRLAGSTTGNTLNGIDVLERDHFAPLKGKRVGLITNPSGRDKNGNSTIDILFHASELKLVALFSPEHGIRGDVDVSVADSIDKRTGLPVYSLYKSAPKRLINQTDVQYQEMVMRSRGPQKEQLENIDILVFDIQDIGARFYTYAATLRASLLAASAYKKPFYVLDRINPIGGYAVEGPVLTDPINFIGFHNVPVRHGMTLGELACMMNAECHLDLDLTIIKCENWNRSMWFDQTGLTWNNPSPAIQRLSAATLYPGLCLLEGTSISLGRGTQLPFEQIGAPYINPDQFLKALNALHIPGIVFQETSFTPDASLYKGPSSTLKLRNILCHGVRITVTDRNACDIVNLGIELALVLKHLYPADFKCDSIEKYLGDQTTYKALLSASDVNEVVRAYIQNLESFKIRRLPFLLYADK